MLSEPRDVLRVVKAYYILDFQDGFLERLSSSEFVALCKEVEKFVCDCELVCDRKSLSLRGCLQSQVSSQFF